MVIIIVVVIAVYAHRKHPGKLAAQLNVIYLLCVQEIFSPSPNGAMHMASANYFFIFSEKVTGAIIVLIA